MNKKKLSALEAIYKRVPAIECKGLCHLSCGPISMGAFEAKRIEKKVHALPVVNENLSCSMLKDGRCSVYAIRPLICRLYGVSEGMRCPFGCVPQNVLSRPEAYDLLEEALRL